MTNQTTCTTCQPTIDVAELAAQDQADARERNFERRAMPWLLGFIVAFCLTGAYAAFGVAGDVPLPSWSPIGQIQQYDDEPLEPAPVEIPEGYEPAVPVEPPSQSI